MDTDFRALTDDAATRAVLEPAISDQGESVLIHLDAADAMACGILPVIELNTGFIKGSIFLLFDRLDSTSGEIAWEPAEPDAQARAKEHARRNPVAFAMELLGMALEQDAMADG